jgi:Tol biopolymer transport system component
LGIEVKNGKPVDAPVVLRSDFGDRAKRITHSGNLAFDLSRGGGSDVYLIEVNPTTGESGSPQLVTKSFFGQHFRSAWSADGKKLAYLRMRQEGTAPLLCMISLSDGREESFETGMRYMNSVFLSPDGKTVALSPAGKGDKYGIHLFSLETHEIRPFVLSDDFRPKGFSADGREFLLFQAGNRNENIAVEVATGKERKVEFPEKVGVGYAISPDGLRIVYDASDPGGKESTLILADLNFKQKQIIARSTRPFHYSAASLRWSPDGTKIAYPYPVSDEKTELRVRAADGSWERTVNTGKLQFIYFPEWSPDSTKLALTLWEQGVSEIGILENFLPKTEVTTK